MALLFLILSFNIWAKSVPDGYPRATVNIIYDKEAIIKNDFCFPVVVTVNEREFMVQKNSSLPLGVHQWTSWSWMPGQINGRINSKTVLHPLRSKPKVSFGPEEVETHKGPNSFGYDFSVPVGTSVLAMEKGKVIRVIQHYKEAHQDKSRLHETNTIEILHEDGTVARYSHLQTGKVRVKPCEDIRAGQVLAQTGNVGFSKGPHLHVDIFRPVDGENYRTFPLKFQ